MNLPPPSSRQKMEAASMISGFRREVDENSGLLVITHPVVVIPYRRFGTTYRNVGKDLTTLKDGTNRLSRNVGNE